MIVSFHPIFTADHNVICAGRPLDHGDLDAIRMADAVILPQGCPRALHKMAREYCRHVFPNYSTRFDYPGKMGQIRLFDQLDTPYPPTETHSSVHRFRSVKRSHSFPLVIKLNWGGEGHTTFKAENQTALDSILDKVAAHERSGRRGFISQQWITSQDRCLRVVLVGRRIESYWREQPMADRFGTAVSAGADINYDADPHLQAAGQAAAARIGTLTGLQLAGFDFIFDTTKSAQSEPLILEINYYFGRKGIGGSDRFYGILVKEIDAWLQRRGLHRGLHDHRKIGSA